MSKANKNVAVVLAGLALVCAVMFSTGIAGFDAAASDSSAALDNASMQMADGPELGGSGGG